MPEFSPLTKKLIQGYKDWYQSLQPKEKTATVQVDEVALAVAAFYERIREIVDWREEHLIRKAAIERILKRRLLLFKQSGPESAEPLVLELIRGGHFPNNKIPETKITQVQKSLGKYILLLESLSGQQEKQKLHLQDRLLTVAACEVEEILAPAQREQALLEYMTDSLKERIVVRRGVLTVGGITEEEKYIQVYIACQQALFKMDSATIVYNLLKKLYPRWQDFAETTPELQEISNNIFSIWQNLEKAANHPLAKKFYRLCERYDTPYLILGDILSEDPLAGPEAIKNPEELEKRISSAYQKRAQKLKIRTRRAAVFATISIFLTKILLALALEVPFDRYVTGQFSYSTLGLNIAIPPLLMLFLIASIRPPKKENLQRVAMETIKIAYATERIETYQISPAKKRGLVINSIITLFYLSTFFVVFGAIIWGLNKLNFGVLSIAIFLVFTSLISFAGIKLRERAKELEIMGRKESGLIFFIDLFSLPIIRMGKWLSGQWARYNVIIVLINFLIDMPFQVFVEFLEKWREFLKEKKEEIH